MLVLAYLAILNMLLFHRYPPNPTLSSLNGWNQSSFRRIQEPGNHPNILIVCHLRFNTILWTTPDALYLLHCCRKLSSLSEIPDTAVVIPFKCECLARFNGSSSDFEPFKVWQWYLDSSYRYIQHFPLTSLSAGSAWWSMMRLQVQGTNRSGYYQRWWLAMGYIFTTS